MTTSVTLRRRLTTCVFSTTLVALLFSAALFAQGNFGRILGAVTDQTGAVLPGAQISIIDKDRGLARSVTTDEAGLYNAPTLLPGTYTVRVELPGFKKLDRENVVLEVGQEIRVDLTIEPGQQSETVTINEAIPLVDTTGASLGGVLNNSDINDMPLNGRNYQALLGLRPGVALYPGGSPWTQSTNNMRPDQTTWMVEGISNANGFDNSPVVGGGSAISDGSRIMPLDAIQEFNLQENSKAEYAGKPGAVVNIGIRSGTNQFHGSAYAFGRNGAWDARNVFNPAPNPVNPLDLEQYGGVLGGPIKKDKLFFFGGFEALHSSLGNAFVTPVPYTGPGTPADPAHSMVDAINALTKAGVPLSPVSLKIFGCTTGPTACTGGVITNALTNSVNYASNYPNTNDSHNGIGKIDYRINDRHSVNGMLFRSVYSATGQDFPQVNPVWLNAFPQDAWTISGNWIWSASSSLVNEFRVGFNQAYACLCGLDNKLADGQGWPINTGVTSIPGFPTVVISGFGQTRLGPRRTNVQFLNSPYYNWQDSISYLRGNHAFKFGVDIARSEANSNNDNGTGRIDFHAGFVPQIPKSTALESFFAGNAFRGTLLIGNPRLETTSWGYGMFFQDDWRITPRIMLNLGLRYNYKQPLHDIHNHLGNFDPNLGMVQQGQPSVGDTVIHPDRTNFSPRLGFAWDLTGKGTTVIRAGGGVFYSVLVLANSVANPAIANGAGSMGNMPTGACTTSPPVGSPCPQTFGGTITSATALLPGSALNWNGVVFPKGVSFSCTAAAPCSIGSVDPNLKTPVMGTWNFGIQHAFTNNLSLEVSYVGNHADRETVIVDLNQCAVPNDGTCVRPYAARFPYLRFINYGMNAARSNYNSLQSTLRQRLSHGLSFTVGYTYGHGLDNGSLNRFAGLVQNSLNPGLEYGNSDFDIRHRGTITASYDIPGTKRYGQILSGWKLNTIVTLSGSMPWNMIDSGDNFSNTGELTDRWDFFGKPSDFKSQGTQSLPYCTGPDAGGCSVTSGVSGIQTFFSAGDSTAMWQQCQAVAPDPTTLEAGGCYVKGKSVMVPPKAGTFGTMGRNIFRDTGFKNVDFSVFKIFTFKERVNATFRVEFFNFFNHPIIANPFGSVTGSNSGSDPSSGTTFGCGCITPDFAVGNPIVGSGDARRIQLGLKLNF
jgi:Carboxypeptidase regulatory-like domain/TonB dependent receptor